MLHFDLQFWIKGKCLDCFPFNLSRYNSSICGRLLAFLEKENTAKCFQSLSEISLRQPVQ